MPDEYTFEYTFPEMDAINFATDEDADKACILLNEMNDRIHELQAENHSYQAAIRAIKDFVKQV